MSPVAHVTVHDRRSAGGYDGRGAVRLPKESDCDGRDVIRLPEAGDCDGCCAVRLPKTGDDDGCGAVRLPKAGDCDGRGAVRLPEESEIVTDVTRAIVWKTAPRQIRRTRFPLSRLAIRLTSRTLNTAKT